MRQTGSDITQSGGGELRNQRHLMGNRGKLKQRGRKKPEQKRQKVREEKDGSGKLSWDPLGVNWE